jgi:hypothetical protein
VFDVFDIFHWLQPDETPTNTEVSQPPEEVASQPPEETPLLPGERPPVETPITENEIPTIPAVKEIASGEKTVGDSVVFGNFGGREITWQVLAVEDGRALVITQDLIDIRLYNEKPGNIAWESCTLRTWLNADFLNTAFTEDERKAIALTHLENPDNQGYGTDGGADTDDYVFLLSTAEAGVYFSSNDARIARINFSDSIIDDAAKRFDESPYHERLGFSGWSARFQGWNGVAGWWWLRSPGSNSGYAAGVDYQGGISTSGRDNIAGELVRPVLWLEF